MTIQLSATATGSTTASFSFSGIGGGATAIDLQISTRPDFSFCVCPIYRIGTGSSYTAPGLNQATRYYARARTRFATSVEAWSNVEGFYTTLAASQATAPATVMIEPALIVVPEPAIETSVANLVAGFPASNLFVDSPVAMRKTADSAGAFAIAMRTAGGPADVVALLNTNLPEAAQIEVRFATSLANLTNGGHTFSSGILAARASANLPGRPGYHSLVRLAAAQPAPWIRVAITNADLPGAMLHVEHLVVGLNRVTKNHALDKTETPAPTTSVDRRRSGVVDRVRGLPMRKVDMELSNLTEAQYETVYGDLWRRENDAVLVVPNTKSGGFLHDRILLGDLAGGRTTNPSSPRYSRSVSINSII